MIIGIILFVDGLLLVDKSAGWTSFDVVNYVRKILTEAQDPHLDAAHESGEKRSEPYTGVQQGEAVRKLRPKVGHTGTLDPLATGLLVLTLGSYCKRAQEFSKLDKIYEVTMKLGETSTTGDKEGEISPFEPSLERGKQSLPASKALGAPRRQDLRSSVNVLFRMCPPGAQSFLAPHPSSNGENIPTREQVEGTLQQFVGDIEQVPPAYSAIKIGGQRAYKLARAGKEVKLESRTVHIHSITLNKYKYPFVYFTARVSSGTYIRSLVEDIGQKLGTGAYTSELRRTSVGTFSLEEAVPLKTLTVEHIQRSLVTQNNS